MSQILCLHHFPGRIRFKVTMLKQQPTISDWLKTSLLGLQGIAQVRVNPLAASIAIDYDPQLLAPQVIEQRLQALDLSQATHAELEEHEFTRGDIAMNIIGTLATALLPQKWGALSTAVLIAPSLKHGLESLQHREINTELLDAIALGLSLWRQDYRTAMMTQSLISLGEYMEQATSRNSDQVLADLMRPQECQVWQVLPSGERQQIHSSQLQVGDVIELNAGSAIPIDGRVCAGMALINQASLTGESVPVRREIDAPVYAGTSIHEGQIQVIVDKIGSEATTAQIASLIYDSLSQKSETQQVTQAMAERRVKITLGIGAAVFALTQDINRVASVFLVDYSCALKLSTPVTFKSIMYRAAQQGILMKGGSAIEKLADIDVCVFDKTGTLTYGDMEVTEVIPLPQTSGSTNCAKELLALAASVEEHSHHPLSQAVVNAAKAHQLPHINHGEVEYVIAHGLKTTLNDQLLVIGSRHFLEHHEAVDFSPHQATIDQYQQQGRHLIFISHQQQLIGFICLRDTLRQDAKHTLARLRQLGVKEFMMISGDSQFKAQQMGELLGLDYVIGEAEPADKSALIAQLQAQGKKVLFIGDGVNDAPALTMADVGVAMSQGTDLARQTADIVLLHDHLEGIAEAKALAQLAMGVIHSNIKVAEYVNSGIMLAAAMGWLSPSVSALLHNGTTIGILARSAALRHQPAA